MPRLSKIGAACLAAFGWTSGGTGAISASYLVVGGGGGGSFNTVTGGGGGAGGALTGTTSLSAATTYTVTVGAGGAKASNNAFGENGTAGGVSSFSTITTTAPTYPSLGASGTSGNGYAGGSAGGNGSGGGGGASAVGGNASSGQGGAGGAGITSSISGTSTQYAGGGSGGSDTATPTASVYGGGVGATNAANGVDAQANTGGGGGGGRSGYFSGSYYAASNGGSGIVIISYPAPQLFWGGFVTTSGGNIIHTFTTSGSLTPVTTTVSASYLVVAGGGSGGQASNYTSGTVGGGGAGGMQTGTTTLTLANSYTVIVGAGGAASVGTGSFNAVGNKGSDSQFGSLTASVGGGGGNVQDPGGNGGSGGGAGYNGTPGSGTAGQGNNGGSFTGTPGPGNYAAAGGGGAGAVGGSNSGDTGGAGGVGLASSISGTSTYYAGGGGAGGALTASAGAGGNGGGGAGGAYQSNGTRGTANTGGGGGGSGSGNAAVTVTSGAGGSGVVIISYAGQQLFGGGVVTFVNGNTIHTFNTSGTLTPLSQLSADYLIVAGGAGGGGAGGPSWGGGGGGGAGGLLSGSGLIIDTASTYLVTVGSGGAGATSSTGTSGGNSAFSVVPTTAIGGGGGGSWSSGTTQTAASNGGSGGGGTGYSATPYTGGAGTSGQGYAGGTAGGSVGFDGAGGGGAGSVGSNVSAAPAGGNGGTGVASSISGTSSYYAGGGGGGAYNGHTAGTGGSSVGGAGGSGVNGQNGFNATANTGSGGGGGGGGGFTSGATGGNGAGGIVIIRYAGSTQLMAGGTVTITGGYVIHTFTSSGYLAPLKYVGNSLRFRSSNSAYLSKTMTAPTNNLKWTFSAWIKRGSTFSTENQIINAGTTGSDDQFVFTGSSQLGFYIANGGSYYLITNAVYRDPAAWYHIVFVYDSANATASNRLLLYVNGTQVTSFATALYPTQNYASQINSAVLNRIGLRSNSTSPFDGYMAEINFVDGQALTPNAFGSFNSYGVWQPITYGGSYGTNGFYLPFNQGSSSYYGTFNGSTQYLTVADNAALQPGSGAWTVEFWAYVTGSVGAGDYEYYTKGAGIQVYINSATHNWRVALSSNNTTTYFIATDIGTPVANTWQHIAVTYDGTTYRGFLNGVQGFATASATLASTGSSNVAIGAYSTSPSGYGNISNVRFVKGSAVYTANFVPPTSPLTNISGTGLLTLQSATIVDNSSNAFTITNNGSVTTTASSTIFANTVTLTADQSPAQNNWTTNNFSLTAGNTYDSMVDVPTLTSATAANYAVLNPLWNSPVLTNANLQLGYSSQWAASTLGVTTGKFYFEATILSQNTYNLDVGVMNQNHTGAVIGASANSWGIIVQSNSNNGDLWTNGTTVASGVTFTTNDVVNVAFDIDAGKIWFGKNGTWVQSGNPATAANPQYTNLSGTIFGAGSSYQNSGGSLAFNFGQQGFKYTPPAGYLPLNTYNM